MPLSVLQLKANAKLKYGLISLQRMKRMLSPKSMWLQCAMHNMHNNYELYYRA